MKEADAVRNTGTLDVEHTTNTINRNWRLCEICRC